MIPKQLSTPLGVGALYALLYGRNELPFPLGEEWEECSPSLYLVLTLGESGCPALLPKPALLTLSPEKCRVYLPRGQIEGPAPALAPACDKLTPLPRLSTTGPGPPTGEQWELTLESGSASPHSERTQSCNNSCKALCK